MRELKKYDAAIFDVDGTLLDTTEGILAAVQYTIKQQNLPELSYETLLTFIGPPIQDSFRKAYGLSDEAVQKLATIFRNRYKEKELFKASPYEGIYDVLYSLKEKGVRLGIATYKRQDYAEEILKHFYFDRYCDIIYGADHENKLKKNDIILRCIEAMAVKDKKRIVMIGDSSHDAIGASQIGIDFIGVTFGFDFRSEQDVNQYPAVGCAQNPKELLKYIII